MPFRLAFVWPRGRHAGRVEYEASKLNWLVEIKFQKEIGAPKCCGICRGSRWQRWKSTHAAVSRRVNGRGATVRSVRYPFRGVSFLFRCLYSSISFFCVLVSFLSLYESEAESGLFGFAVTLCACVCVHGGRW